MVSLLFVFELLYGCVAFCIFWRNQGRIRLHIKIDKDK